MVPAELFSCMLVGGHVNEQPDLGLHQCAQWSPSLHLFKHHCMQAHGMQRWERSREGDKICRGL